MKFNKDDGWAIGSHVALCGLFAASLGFGMYLEHFANYVSTYAGPAGVVIGLLFMYLPGVIFILGDDQT